jgi:cell division protein FtsQ
MKRSIWFWVCFFVAIVMAIYFATRIIMTGMGHGPVAQIHSISITSDAEKSDLSALRAAAGGLVRNTYDVDLTELNERIGNVPGVKSSAVRRLPNGNLKINVKMHHAVALWWDGEHYYPLSADGTVVNRPTLERDETAVVFAGPIPNDITEITKAAHTMLSDIGHLSWIENRRWNITTTGGIVVMLPENNPVSAISTLIAMNQNHKILSKDIDIIDMRDSARILVK